MWALLCDRIETTPGLEIYLISLHELLVEYSLLDVCPMTSSLELDREKSFHGQEMTGLLVQQKLFLLTHGSQCLAVSCFSPSAPAKPLRTGTRSGD